MDSLCKCASMLTKLAGDGKCRLGLFYAMRKFLANEIYHFSRLFYQTWAACSISSAPYSATLDDEITLKILEFILGWIEKVKPGFSFSSMCIFPESNETKC